MGDHVKSFVSGIECSCYITFPTWQEQIHINNNRKKCWSFFHFIFYYVGFLYFFYLHNKYYYYTIIIIITIIMRIMIEINFFKNNP